VDISITMEAAPAAADIAALQEALGAHNRAWPLPGVSELAALARDEKGLLVGGIYGWTWAGWLEIETAWLPVEARGQGLGRRLLEALERTAAERGCRHALVDTFSFQAPGFYLRLGYQVFGLLEGEPAEYRKYFLRKELHPCPAHRADV
jgi:GNAT superfamily N-acetyltransferase